MGSSGLFYASLTYRKSQQNRIYFHPYVLSFLLWAHVNFVWPVGGGKSLRGFSANLDLFLNLFKIIIVSQELAEKHVKGGPLRSHTCVHVPLCCCIECSFLNHHHSQDPALSHCHVAPSCPGHHGLVLHLEKLCYSVNAIMLYVTF